MSKNDTPRVNPARTKPITVPDRLAELKQQFKLTQLELVGAHERAATLSQAFTALNIEAKATVTRLEGVTVLLGKSPNSIQSFPIQGLALLVATTSSLRVTQERMERVVL